MNWNFPAVPTHTPVIAPAVPTHTPVIAPTVPTYIPGKPSEYNGNATPKEFTANYLLSVIWNPLSSEQRKNKAYSDFIRIYLSDWRNIRTHVSHTYIAPFESPKYITYLSNMIDHYLKNTEEDNSLRKELLFDLSQRIYRQYSNLIDIEFRKLRLGGSRTRRCRRRRALTRRRRSGRV